MRFSSIFGVSSKSSYAVNEIKSKKNHFKEQFCSFFFGSRKAKKAEKIKAQIGNNAPFGMNTKKQRSPVATPRVVNVGNSTFYHLPKTSEYSGISAHMALMKAV